MLAQWYLNCALYNISLQCSAPVCMFRLEVMSRLEKSRLEIFRLEMSRLEMSRLEMSRLELFRLEMSRLEMLRLKIDFFHIALIQDNSAPYLH